jgi:hypothetical protein
VREAIERVENRAVRGEDKLLIAAIIFDRHSRVGAGFFTGDEIAVAKVNKQAALPIGGISEGLGAVGRLVCIADQVSRVSAVPSWAKRV